jgi:hypothetical protein
VSFCLFLDEEGSPYRAEESKCLICLMRILGSRWFVEGFRVKQR